MLSEPTFASATVEIHLGITSSKYQSGKEHRPLISIASAQHRKTTEMQLEILALRPRKIMTLPHIYCAFKTMSQCKPAHPQKQVENLPGGASTQQVWPVLRTGLQLNLTSLSRYFCPKKQTNLATNRYPYYRGSQKGEH